MSVAEPIAALGGASPAPAVGPVNRGVLRGGGGMGKTDRHMSALLLWPQPPHIWPRNLSRVPRVACQPAPSYLPITEKDHCRCLIQQGSFLLPSTHTHLGGSEMIDWRLRPQHMAEDGSTPLLVRESSLAPGSQGPEPVPRAQK